MTETIRPEGEGWSSVDQVDESPALTPLEQAIPAERWRRWEPPALVEDSLTDIVVEDGEKSRALDITWSQDVLNKIKAGYQCLKCMEPQPEPFPEVCGNPMCSYPMRKLQAEDYEHEFQGDKWVGPTTSLEEHLGILEEKSERKAYKPGSSIIVPGWAKV